MAKQRINDVNLSKLMENVTNNGDMNDTSKFRMAIYSIGRPQLLLARPGQEWNKAVTIGTWDGKLPRTLFFMIANRQPVLRDVIFDTVWSGLSVKEATNVYHVTKRKINERIGIALRMNELPPEVEAPTVTLYIAAQYWLNPKWAIYHDVSALEELVHQLDMGTYPDPLSGWRQAAELARGDFLETIEILDHKGNVIRNKWLEDRRDQMKSLQLRAYTQVGSLDPDLQTSVLYLAEALKIQPFYDSAALTLMRRYDMAHKFDKALTVYRKFHEAWVKRFHHEPASQLREYAAEIEAHSGAGHNERLRDE